MKGSSHDGGEDAAGAPVHTTALTLEQLRAQDAWRCARGQDRGYANLAKTVPGLIMTSGLLQVLAYLHAKSHDGRNHQHGALALHLRNWLRLRFADVLGLSDSTDEFGQFMDALMRTDAATFQDITTEAFAWLRWMRQIAPAMREPGVGEP